MKKIMTHLVAGYPSLEASEKIALTMAENGADYVEIQIPFSDPVADGPVIAKANQAALDNGTRVNDCFKMMKRLSAKTKTPLLFMTYFNIVHHYGIDDFCKKAEECGARGLIVPDIPVDEEKHEGYLKACKKSGLYPIQVISPLTPERRLKKIAKVSEEFVYCVSRYGTTGAKSTLNPKLSSYLKKVRKEISLPLAVGFGVSEKKHVEAIHKDAEIAVMGSVFMGMSVPEIKKFLNSLK